LCGVSPLVWSSVAEAPSPERSILVYEVRDESAPDDPMGSLADERGSERGGLQEDLKVQRSEEEVRAGVREREAGRVSARKSVRTEREMVRVPKRREEVDIKRVPVEGEAREASGATEADIGEDEVVLQVFEEEVVVTKRIVLKEEIRLRKRVAWDEETVEVDLRKEEVEIDDSTERGAQQAPLTRERW
jgi:uncharacterized protein (TIGR02271 family)